jgi:hypothetical protein
MTPAIPTGLRGSPDGESFRWSCVYCLDHEATGWLPASLDTLAFFAGVERVHFATHHSPSGMRDTVLREGISLDLSRQATRDAAVAATERDQRIVWEALGITAERSP